MVQEAGLAGCEVLAQNWDGKERKKRKKKNDEGKNSDGGERGLDVEGSMEFVPATKLVKVDLDLSGVAISPPAAPLTVSAVK